MRILIPLALILVLTAAIVAANRHGDPASAVPGAELIVFAEGEPQNADAALAALAGARRVSTLDELRAAAGPGTLIVIDRSAFASANGEFLRQQLEAGVPVLGLNIPLADLAEASGYLSVMAEVNPVFRSKASVPSAPVQPFYSYVWVGADAARHSVSAQKDFAAGLFPADLERLSLAALGLVRDPERGDVVTFEEYDSRGALQ